MPESTHQIVYDNLTYEIIHGAAVPATVSPAPNSAGTGIVHTFIHDPFYDLEPDQESQEDSYNDDFDAPEPSVQPTAHWSTGPIPPYSIKKPQKRVTKSKDVFYNRTVQDFLCRTPKVDGEVGLEIECEGTFLFDSPIQYWEATSDGSLRVCKGHPPIEYRLRKPLLRSEVPKALGYLSNQLRRAGSSVEESTRTSVHVHVNCQGMTVKATFTYICLYLFFESLLVDFSGPTRVGNLFCLRAKDAQYWVWCICQMFLNNGDTSIVCNENFRYTSCNTDSLRKFGSLEFRSMRGTVNPALIQVWVDLLLHLKDASEEYEDPSKLYEDYVSLGSTRFFGKVFSSRPDLMSILTGVAGERLSQSIEEGSEFVRDISMSIPEWKKKKTREELKKLESETKNSDPDRLNSAVEKGIFKINSSTKPTLVAIQTESGEKICLVPEKSKVWFDDEGFIAYQSYAHPEPFTFINPS